MGMGWGVITSMWAGARLGRYVDDATWMIGVGRGWGGVGANNVHVGWRTLWTLR